MRGGRLEIAGNAGDVLAAPLAGELAGMAGGLLVVHGDAGARAGDRMRRGLVAALRGAGENAGCRMVAGTLVVAGGAGPMPGMLMRRGSILLDRAPAALSPSFVESGAPDSVFARLVDRHLLGRGNHPAAAVCGDAAPLRRRQCRAGARRGGVPARVSRHRTVKMSQP